MNDKSEWTRRSLLASVAGIGATALLPCLAGAAEEKKGAASTCITISCRRSI